MKKISHISKIVVDKLFGYYSYTLPKPKEDKNVNEMFILYGSNGCGKTTILNLVYWLLSTRDGKGYKTNISKVKFENFKVQLNNGYEIGAERENSVLGAYTYYITKGDKILKSVLLEPNKEGSIRIINNPDREKEYYEVINIIKGLNIAITYLNDSRDIFESFPFEEETIMDIEDNPENRILRDTKVRRKKILDNALNQSLFKLNNWINEQIIKSRWVGEEDTQNVYIELMKKFLSKGGKKSQIDQPNYLNKLFNNILEQNKNYAEFGIINPFKQKETEEILKKSARSNKQRDILNILEPYLDSMYKKLSAFEEINKLLKLFLNIVNSYFSNKNIEYKLKKGFTIYFEKKEKLEFNQLSSGEKQLLILLMNTMTAKDKSTIFIIDEPEISFNISWQRKFLETLSKLNISKRVQFILATHSIELITDCPNSIVEIKM